MDTLNPNINLGGNSNPTVDTSSSINNEVNGTQQTSQPSSISTGSYQSNGIYTGAETETYDLSGETAEDNRNFFQRASDWISDTANSVYNTGAEIVNDIKTWASTNLLGAGSTLAETAANLASDVGTFAAKVGSAFLEGIATLKSTEAVIATSVVSGVAKLVEHFADISLWCRGNLIEGQAYVAGAIVGLFNREIGEAIKNDGHQANQQIKEWIAFDAVGEANKWFYESTDLGRFINEYSLMKYDSEVAMKIREVSEKAAEIAAATALTITTGGAATFAIGALYGMGKTAESTYQRNGTDTSLLQELGIVGSGALTGLSWMATGKLFAGFLEIGKAAAEVGVTEVISKISKDILTKDFWLKALKEGLTGWNGVGNYAASAMMTGEELIPYITGEKEWTPQAIGKLALLYLGNLGLNVAEDALRGYINNFKADQVIEEIQTNSLEKLDDIDDTTKKIVKIAPQTELKTDDDVVEFANTYLTDTAIKEAENQQEYIESAMSQIKGYLSSRIASDPTGAYYSLMTFTSSDMDKTVMSRIVTDMVNSSADFRKTILVIAENEALESMGKAMGITDQRVIDEIVDCLLGKDFVEGGLGAGSDWDRIKEIILPYVQEQVQNSPDGVVLWTKVSNTAVAANYSTSIENVTTGSTSYFLETLFCNFNGEVEGTPKCERLWGIISEAYAETCSNLVDSAGNPITQLKLLVPRISTNALDYGNTFSQSELPTLLRLGTINSIDVIQVAGFDDLSPVIHKEVDITGLRELYQTMLAKGASSETISSVIFSEFLRLLGGA